MPRYRLILAYDGTDFHGWQRQELPADHPSLADGGPKLASHTPNGLRSDNEVSEHAVDDNSRARVALRTVQHVVQQAVRETVRQPVQVIGASRTDSGVHAWCQTAAFTCEGEGGRPPDERLAEAITARLPDDVVVRSCVRTRNDFDPIGDCVAKGYVYALHVSRKPPLWDRRYVHQVHSPLDERAMNEAAGVLVGTHDFAAFAATGHGRESTVRTIFACEVRRPGPERVEVHISGDGFLWNMVRIVAGTLVEVGRGRMSVEDVRRALESRDRTQAGPTLPPTGLCLMWARYPEDSEAETHGDSA